MGGIVIVKGRSNGNMNLLGYIGGSLGGCGVRCMQARVSLLYPSLPCLPHHTVHYHVFVSVPLAPGHRPCCRGGADVHLRRLPSPKQGEEERRGDYCLGLL
jgi:hypothetical protein